MPEQRIAEHAVLLLEAIMGMLVRRGGTKVERRIQSVEAARRALGEYRGR